ncbi:MAG: AAA family ATPase [Alphaproteobacteria bacterium]|nr:AAA family ATPase [Alphaproteobacteria bacterium]
MRQPDQNEIIEFLASGRAFGGAPVRHIETHISHVFLVGDRAWKLKRAVRFNFLDFSTAERRRDACDREVVLNRRTAPSLYLGIRPVTWDERCLAIDGEGAPVDWLVEMRRFDERTLLHRCARSGHLTPELAADLVERVVAFHEAAERRLDKGTAAAMRRNARDVAANLREFGGGQFDLGAVDSWAQRIDQTLLSHAALIEQRREAGFVRQCHGDLHLANICIVDGEPTLFDCIEFSDDIACIDVLFDLAFLLMDLLFHGLHVIANLVLNRYLSATRDFGGLVLMPAMLSLRAAIRGMAVAIEIAEDGDPTGELGREARIHFGLALRLLERPVPRLIAVGGLSGTGKSSLAAALAVRLAPGAGAVVVASDVVRKRLFGCRPEDRLPDEAYAEAVSERVYARLFDDVRKALGAGQVVIADATWIRQEDRRDIAELAPPGLRFSGLWLDAPEGVLRARVAARTGDPSDADVAVLARQLSQNPGSIEWTRLDAAKSGVVTEALLAISS